MELPRIYQVRSKVQETPNIFTLSLSTSEKEPFEFLPGQFNMLYLFGIGELPISVCSNFDKKEELLHSVFVSPASQGFQNLQKGDEIGIRGPFGTSWPLLQKGSDVLVIAGGIALAPLRTALFLLAANADQYKKITLLYGARTPEDIPYRSDMEFWKDKGIDVQVVVDHADKGWRGRVGFNTTLIGAHVYDPKNTFVFISGPESMTQAALKELFLSNVTESNIFLAMERNMKCGVGLCGHCQFGPYFICKNGPIFSYPQVKKWLTIKEL